MVHTPTLCTDRTPFHFVHMSPLDLLPIILLLLNLLPLNYCCPKFAETVPELLAAYRLLATKSVVVKPVFGAAGELRAGGGMLPATLLLPLLPPPLLRPPLLLLPPLQAPPLLLLTTSVSFPPLFHSIKHRGGHSVCTR